MSTSNQPNFESFSNFISAAKVKYENNVGISEPIDYVASLLEKLRILNVLDKVDTELINQYVKSCQKILDEEISAEDHIFPHLLKLAQYLVSFIKKLDEEGTSDQRKKSSENAVESSEFSKTDKSDQNCILESIDVATKEVSSKNKTKNVVNEMINKQIVESNPKENRMVIEDNTEINEVNIEDKLVEANIEMDEENTNEDMVEENTNEDMVEDDIIDEAAGENIGNQEDDDSGEELSEKDEKILLRIEKYDQFCIRARKAIEDLDNQELSYKEMENFDSNYIKANILKKRFTESYKRLRKLCRQNPHLVDGEIPNKFGGQFSRPIVLKNLKYPEINEKLTQKLDKTKSFPDFFDVNLWVIEANEEAKLNLKKEVLEEIARNSFKEIGRILKERRKKDTEKSFNSRLTETDNDSHFENIHKDKELMCKLKNNKKVASHMETTVFNSFADKQELETVAEKDSMTDCDEENSIDEKDESENEENLDSESENSKNDTEDDETETESNSLNDKKLSTNESKDKI